MLLTSMLHVFENSLGIVIFMIYVVDFSSKFNPSEYMSLHKESVVGPSSMATQVIQHDRRTSCAF